ncbi:unnamed protein product [Dicrocoelium dendriticum]|nr:unnamed protein product [Dicrocoelium dendriticum]
MHRCYRLFIFLLLFEYVHPAVINTTDGPDRLYRFKRIIGGSPVRKGTYPWAVSVQAKRHSGLGALLRPNNEHYCGGNLEYDIALFQLKEAPVLRKINDLAPLRLPDSRAGEKWPAAGQTCIAVGWGCSFAEGPPTMKIQAIELPVLPPNVCRKMYSAYINLTTSHEFCAGYHKGNRGICPGDSGGPLACPAEDGSLQLAGIVSATHAKQPADYPAVFTRVSYFSDWISQVIKMNPPKIERNIFSFIHVKN